jgi:hypothetical protein
MLGGIQNLHATKEETNTRHTMQRVLKKAVVRQLVFLEDKPREGQRSNYPLDVQVCNESLHSCGQTLLSSSDNVIGMTVHAMLDTWDKNFHPTISLANK